MAAFIEIIFDAKTYDSGCDKFCCDKLVLLDLNLGKQTSLPVAKVLADKGIPFALATGYGDTDSIVSQKSRLMGQYCS